MGKTRPGPVQKGKAGPAEEPPTATRKAKACCARWSSGNERPGYSGPHKSNQMNKNPWTYTNTLIWPDRLLPVAPKNVRLTLNHGLEA